MQKRDILFHRLKGGDPSRGAHYRRSELRPVPFPDWLHLPLSVCFQGIAPLWMRQIPYTMMKFACFERTVELLYNYVVPKPRSQCSKPEQLVVTFIAGYIAGWSALSSDRARLSSIPFFFKQRCSFSVLLERLRDPCSEINVVLTKCTSGSVMLRQKA